MGDKSAKEQGFSSDPAVGLVALVMLAFVHFFAAKAVENVNDRVWSERYHWYKNLDARIYKEKNGCREDSKKVCQPKGDEAENP